jgi:hypothetical protein
MTEEPRKNTKTELALAIAQGVCNFSITVGNLGAHGVGAHG